MTDDQIRAFTRLKTKVEYLEKDIINLRTEIRQRKAEIIHHVNEQLKPISEAIKEIQSTTKATAELIAMGKGGWKFVVVSGGVIMALVGIGKLVFEMLKFKI